MGNFQRRTFTPKPKIQPPRKHLPLRIPLLKLDNNCCRWPIERGRVLTAYGLSSHREWLFCGISNLSPESMYCKYHAWLADARNFPRDPNPYYAPVKSSRIPKL